MLSKCLLLDWWPCISLVFKLPQWTLCVRIYWSIRLRKMDIIKESTTDMYLNWQWMPWKMCHKFIHKEHTSSVMCSFMKCERKKQLKYFKKLKCSCIFFFHFQAYMTLRKGVGPKTLRLDFKSINFNYDNNNRKLNSSQWRKNKLWKFRTQEPWWIRKRKVFVGVT